MLNVAKFKEAVFVLGQHYYHADNMKHKNMNDSLVPHHRISVESQGIVVGENRIHGLLVFDNGKVDEHDKEDDGMGEKIGRLCGNTPDGLWFRPIRTIHRAHFFEP